MAEGTIKKLIPEKQIGFIQPDGGGKNVFFHFSWLKGIAVREGQRVQFDVEQGDKGPRARNLRVLGAAPLPEAIATAADTSGYRFLNPYNFVRYVDQPRQQGCVLGDCPPPPHDRYVGLTGRITCKVEAVTPLFISDSHAVQEQNGHKIYRFFQVDGRPALPASSLRGMVRSVFEAVTNSCFVAFQEDEPYPLEHRESRAPDMIPARVVGLGENGARLELLDCTVNAPGSISGRPTVVRAGAVLQSYPPRVLNQRTGQTFNSQESQLPQNAYDGMRVAALVTRTPVAHRSNRYRAFQARQVVPASQHQSLMEDAQFAKVFGWLHLTGPNIENKHDERLFFRWDDEEAGSPQINQISTRYLCECSSAVVAEYNHHLAGYWERLQRDIEELGNHRWPNSTQGVPHPSVFVEKGRQLRIGDLVYVQRDAQGNATMLRPVSMPRIRYTHSRQSLLPDYLKRCQDYRRLCPACRVFGWVREGAEDIGRDVSTAYAGRVRLSHGALIHSTGELPEIPLAILSTPKPTTTSFYLLNSEGQPDATVDYDADGARLRGRKFYRHHGEMLSEQEYRRAGDNKDDQNRTVHGALEPGATFTFTLDFENLAPPELGALLYVLELEDGMFHRLGYAKPLGFGSVKVTVEGVQAIDWETRLKSIESEAGWQSLDGAQHRQEFLETMQTLYGDGFSEVLADLRALLGTPPELPIHYPRPTKAFNPDHPQFEWFMGNKRRAERRGKDLPKAVALKLSANDATGLPRIERDGKDGKG
jgi:CRISPR-associated protein (TIGR03986 family)